MNKKAILLISFGTLCKTAQKNCVEILTDKIKIAFPEYTVKNVFTSVYILKKLREEGEKACSLAEILDILLAEEYEEVVIQPTLLTEGEEYNEKIVKKVTAYQDRFRSIVIVKPILSADENFSMIMKAFIKQIGGLNSEEEVVFMGHGSKTMHNPAYYALQEKLDQHVSYITIGVLEEDRPNFDDVLERLRSKQRKAVYLMPLLFVAGMHVRENMLGDSEISWKSKLERAGFLVRIYDQGLGENEIFQEIYLYNLKRCLKFML